MVKHTTIHTLLDHRIIAILRADAPDGLEEATAILVESGIACVEFTLTTPGALNLIRETTRSLGSSGCIGAGSVLDEAGAAAAIEAGARYLVTPVLRESVIRFGNRHGIPTIIGAMTPTEALTAQEMGADFVKIFPAEKLGPEYLRALLAPMPTLSLIPTGGITPGNVAAYFAAGAAAVGVGSQLLSKATLAKRDWSTLRAQAAAYLTARAQTPIHETTHHSQTAQGQTPL